MSLMLETLSGVENEPNQGVAGLAALMSDLYREGQIGMESLGVGREIERINGAGYGIYAKGLPYSKNAGVLTITFTGPAWKQRELSTELGYLTLMIADGEVKVRPAYPDHMGDRDARWLWFPGEPFGVEALAKPLGQWAVDATEGYWLHREAQNAKLLELSSDLEKGKRNNEVSRSGKSSGSILHTNFKPEQPTIEDTETLVDFFSRQGNEMYAKRLHYNPDGEIDGFVIESTPPTTSRRLQNAPPATLSNIAAPVW
jgi:hypothetical protein